MSRRRVTYAGETWAPGRRWNAKVVVEWGHDYISADRPVPAPKEIVATALEDSNLWVGWFEDEAGWARLERAGPLFSGDTIDLLATSRRLSELTELVMWWKDTGGRPRGKTTFSGEEFFAAAERAWAATLESGGLRPSSETVNAHLREGGGYSDSKGLRRALGKLDMNIRHLVDSTDPAKQASD